MLSHNGATTETIVVNGVKTENQTSYEKIKTKSKRDLSKEPLLKDQEHKWFYEKYRLKPWQLFLHSVYVTLAIHAIFNFPFRQHYKTTIWAYLVASYALFGVFGGIHRHWSHRSFKAKAPLKIIMAIGYFLAAMVPFRQWVIIHRVHHKYSDTDADPHNVKRGFFFSHFGWLLIERPREVVEKYPKIDMSDIDADPVVKFCDKYYMQLLTIINLISVAIPVYMWNESWGLSLWAGVLRNIYTLNITLAINSFAHRFGDKPFNMKSTSSDNKFLNWMTGGEGYHNYHHAFPYDYRTTEIGGLRLDFTGELISFFEKIGWAYDLKKPNESLVRMTIKNRGDGSLLKAATS